MRGGRMCRENLENLLAVLHAACSFDFMAQNGFLAIIMEERAENEASTLPWAVDGPAGKAARNLAYIVLSVAAIDTQRVELHKLSRIVLVQAETFSLLAIE